jgi:hypothetical protein
VNCVGGTLSGANSTNFAVCCVTVPLVLACFGWDGATATQHPMGKLVGNAKFVTVVGGGLADLGGVLPLLSVRSVCGACGGMHVEWC